MLLARKKYFFASSLRRWYLRFGFHIVIKQNAWRHDTYWHCRQNGPQLFTVLGKPMIENDRELT
jgi:hypothetical protein